MELSFPDSRRIQRVDSKIIIQQAQMKGEDFTQQGRYGKQRIEPSVPDSRRIQRMDSKIKV